MAAARHASPGAWPSLGGLLVSPGLSRESHLHGLVQTPHLQSHRPLNPRAPRRGRGLACSHAGAQEQSLSRGRTFLRPALVLPRTPPRPLLEAGSSDQRRRHRNAPQPGLLSCAPRPQPPPGALHANKYQKGRPLNSPLILFCITICPSAEYICIHCEMLSKIPPIINTFPFILEPQSLCNHFKNAEFHFLCVLATFYGRSTLLSPY